MNLRNHPRMIGQWPPKRPVGGSYAGVDQLQIRSELPETAVLLSVEDCPPNDGIQSVLLTTNQGLARIITTADPMFHKHLLQKLQESIGRPLREIGNLEIGF